MKASVNTLESLADIARVETAGDVRRIGAQMLLALARKEISATDLEAAAKMIDAQANHLNAEVKIAKTAIELRERGADLGKIVHLGKTLIGDPDSSKLKAVE
jgi:thioredoxin-like negative regulator of GroEL